METIIIKRRKNYNYTTISTEPLKEKSLSLKAKGILAVIMTLPPSWDFSITGITSVLKENEYAVRSAIGELMKLGYCKRICERDEKGKIKGWVYVFADERELLKEQDVENQLVENPLVGNPLVENRKVDNNKEYKEINKENNKEKRLSNDNPKKNRFVKPTVEQIDDYIREKELDFDAEKFYDYYESKGWMIGKNHMKDWKAACRTWQHNIKSQESKEEKEEAVEIPADDIPKWEQNKKWMQSKMPKWSKKIDYDMFATMRAMVCFNSRQYAAVLEDMYNSGFDGDIVAEFKRRVCYE